MFTHKMPATGRTLLIAVAVVAVLLVVWPRAKAQAGPTNPQSVPHAVADHADCLACHANGLGGAPKSPADHVGRTNEQCITCHTAASATLAPVATLATRSAAPAALPEVPSATPTAQKSGSSAVIHWSSKSCRTCHLEQWNEWSRSGHAMTLAAQLLNSSHNSEEQLDQTCLKCHSPELGTQQIGSIVQPLDTTGPWKLVRQYATLGDAPAISCLACHEPHGPKPTGLPPGEDFGDESTFYRNVPAPQVTNLNTFDALAQRYVDPAPIAPVMNGDQLVPVAQTAANRLCYTCHATDRAESNLFEPNKPPEGDNSVGSGDDRTLTGVHQGIQCITCHMPGGSHTFDPMNSCSQCHGEGTTTAPLSYVTQVRTSRNDPSLSMLSGEASPLNIHWLDKTQVWPPVIVKMTAADGGDKVTYDISIQNLASWDLANITVKGTVPNGAGYLDSWVGDSGHPGTFDGDAMSLHVDSIPAGQTLDSIVYRVLKGTARDLTARAWISWAKEVPGTAVSASVTVKK